MDLSIVVDDQENAAPLNVTLGPGGKPTLRSKTAPVRAPRTPSSRPNSAQKQPNSRTAHNPPTTPSSIGGGSAPSTPSRYKEIEAVRSARKAHTAKKAERAAQLREEWKQEKEAKLQHQATLVQSAKQRREKEQLLSDQRLQDLMTSREAQRNDKAREIECLQEYVEAHALNASFVEDKQKENRRKSMAIRAKIHKEGSKRSKLMEQKKKEEEHSYVEYRIASSKETERARRLVEKNKRKSLAVRASMHKKAKKKQQEQLIQQRHERHEQLEGEYEDWLARREAENQEKARVRQSLETRNAVARRHRELDEQLQREQHDILMDELRLRKEEADDVNQAKHQQIKRARQSLAGRNAIARQHRLLQEQMQREQHEALMEELRIRREEAEDVDNLKKEELQRARESLGMRLQVWRQHREYETELLAEKRELEEEDRQHEEEDREALNESIMRQRERDRMSQAFRIKEVIMARTNAEIEQEKANEQIVLDRQLEYEDRIALQEYHNQLNSNKRTSQLWRSLEHKTGRHWYRAREEDIKAQDELDKSLRDADHDAVLAYKSEQRELRKKSLSYRLQKARRDREYEETVRQFEKLQLQEDLDLRREDWKAVQLHKVLEKRAERETNRAFAAKAKASRAVKNKKN